MWFTLTVRPLPLMNISLPVVRGGGRMGGDRDGQYPPRRDGYAADPGYRSAPPPLLRMNATHREKNTHPTKWRTCWSCTSVIHRRLTSTPRRTTTVNEWKELEHFTTDDRQTPGMIHSYQSQHLHLHCRWCISKVRCPHLYLTQGGTKNKPLASVSDIFCVVV